ncbi:MAG: molybdopterin-dependent oxidoreductase, partial [Rhodobacteraceae bacterium]|nr:molybdopterin-dependent oxidoreductase [Paracoccaceae bacterium]
HKRAFGSDTVPGSYEDLEQADVIVLVGSNLAWCHPVLFQRILAAKSERPELKIITIDPRATASSDSSDLHLAVRADGDSALFNGLLAEIDKRGAVDQDYVASHVSGFQQSLDTAQATEVSETGLPADDLRRFYDLWIGSEKVVTIFSQGVNQSIGGTDKVNAIINCHLATGRIGKPGMGPFSVTGQPNAMGGREVGGLANMLACHLDIENPDHRQTVQDAWQSPTICAKPGLKAVDLFQACEDGKIKALWIMGTNPAVSMPDAESVSRAIHNVDFSVVSEVVETTDTSVLTHVQLPATAWGEKTGTITNSERRISLQKGFLPDPGMALADWRIISGVAQRMGWAKAFTYSSPADIFREYAALSGQAAAHGRNFDISGLADISDAEYMDLKPVKWPVKRDQTTTDRFFANGGFFHADRKARMLPVTPPPVVAQSPGTYQLNTGRIRDQWHTMTRSGKSPRLNQHMTEPFAEINPDDAAALGLLAGELVEITSPKGRALVRVTLTKGMPRGSVFVPMHWSSVNTSAGRVNALNIGITDPISGQPALKSARVHLKRYAAQWYGFATSATPMQPNENYSVVSRTSTGWASELAGTTRPTNWEAEARRILNIQTGCVSQMSDTAKGIVRLAIHDGSTLIGLFFCARSPVTVARDLAITHINTDVAAFTALAGQPAAGQLDPGRTVCACFNVGINTIRRSILDGISTVDGLGNCTSAGTNCGSCKSELQVLIDAVPKLQAAE